MLDDLNLPTLLTPDDHARLQVLMATLTGRRTPLAELVRRKLGTAVLILPSELTPDLVTSGRQVRFNLDGVRSEECTLVWSPNERTTGHALSLLIPRGLALLGLSIGQEISFRTDDDRIQSVAIEYVVPNGHLAATTERGRLKINRALPLKPPALVRRSAPDAGVFS